jgi:hypothetical protein
VAKENSDHGDDGQRHGKSEGAAGEQSLHAAILSYATYLKRRT